MEELIKKMAEKIDELEFRIKQLEDSKRAEVRILEDHLVRLGKWSDNEPLCR